MDLSGSVGQYLRDIDATTFASLPEQYPDLLQPGAFDKAMYDVMQRLQGVGGLSGYVSVLEDKEDAVTGDKVRP